MLLRSLRPEDRPRLKRILHRVGVFTRAEIRVALEVIDSRLAEGRRSGYRFVLADQDGAILGYACFGLIPLTESSYDLYWIVTDPDHRGRGVGTRLLRRVGEEAVRSHGTQIFIETSGLPTYGKTRAFYQKNGYTEIARVPDFYKKGDDKVIFHRRLRSHGPARCRQRRRKTK